MTSTRRLAGWVLALLMAVALCATPARADLIDPDWDERDGRISDFVTPDLEDAEDDADDEDEDTDEDDEDTDEDAEDFDGDGEIDDAAEDEQLVEDVPAERKGGVPLVPLAAGVIVLAAGAATLIIRSGKARGE